MRRRLLNLLTVLSLLLCVAVVALCPPPAHGGQPPPVGPTGGSVRNEPSTLLFLPCLAATVGAPLLTWVWGLMFKGRPYRRARRPLVILGTYYGLCIAHEVAYRFGVPVAFPVMLLLVAGPIVALFVWDARTPRRRGVCANCGYDLRATPDRCPECGVEADGVG